MFAASKTNNVATGGQKDPQFNYVTMLLHGDGTNGAQNNTFLDSSTNNFTITRNGNTNQGSFSPYGSNWSNFFDGASGTRLQIATSTNLDAGTSDFCLECWINGSAAYNSYLFEFAQIVGKGNGVQSGTFCIATYNSVAYGGVFGSTALSGTTIFKVGVWYHIAITRSGTTLRLFVNGVQEASTTNNADLTSTRDFAIGDRPSSDLSGQYPFNGYISNVRFVKGSAVYTSNFTPSTTPLTAITNTQLLTSQSNRFVDNSANNFTVTASGTPSVQRFNPFGTSTAYSTSVIGGSGYFDGAGDTLLVPYSSVMNTAGAYSFEAWVYFSGSNANQGVIGTTSDGFAGFERSSGNWAYYYGISGIGTGVACVLNQWNHVVICRNAGGSGGFFVNGIRLATFTDTANKTSFGNLQIGYNGVAGGAYTTGYISEYRFVQGNPYDPTSSTLTVPTAPLTAISGTVALLNMTNGAIYDNAMMNNLETVGNAQISTSVVKYGTGSMAFDGNGDNLAIPTSPNLNMGTGNFTVECWVYISSRTLNYPLIFGNNNSGYGAGAIALVNSNADSGAYTDRFNLSVYDINPSPTLTASSTNSLNTWYHLTVVRNGTSLVMYRDGTSVASATISSGIVFDWGKLGSRIGGGNWDGAQSYFNGYIDDLRITKGYARYTATFTPPTAAFPNIGPV